MELIDKAAIVAEIKKRIGKLNEKCGETTEPESIISIELCRFECELILDIINSIEVKEVDYERELSKYVSNGIHRFFPNVDDDYCKMDSVTWQDYVIETAQHFYELGLKAKKGE